jgi:thiol-disulfide isomerase/thioredoxin
MRIFRVRVAVWMGIGLLAAAGIAGADDEEPAFESPAQMFGLGDVPVEYLDSHGAVISAAEFADHTQAGESFSISKRAEGGKIVGARLTLTGKKAAAAHDAELAPLPLEVVGTRFEGPALTALDGTPLEWSRPGTVTVLNFWYALCGTCVWEMPTLNRISQRFSRLPVRFVAATFDAPDDVKAFTAKRPFAYTVGTTSAEALNAAIEKLGNGYPVQLVLDGDGVIRGIRNAVHKDDDLDAPIFESLGRMLARRADVQDVAKTTD